MLFYCTVWLRGRYIHVIHWQRFRDVRFQALKSQTQFHPSCVRVRILGPIIPIYIYEYMIFFQFNYSTFVLSIFCTISWYFRQDRLVFKIKNKVGLKILVPFSCTCEFGFFETIISVPFNFVCTGSYLYSLFSNNISCSSYMYSKITVWNDLISWYGRVTNKLKVTPLLARFMYFGKLDLWKSDIKTTCSVVSQTVSVQKLMNSYLLLFRGRQNSWKAKNSTIMTKAVLYISGFNYL